MRVLHVLPHRGGGAETYIDQLERMDGVSHERLPLGSARTALAAAPSIFAGYPRLYRAARRADLVHAHGDVAAVLALPLRPDVWTPQGLHMLRREPRFGPAVRAVTRRALTLCSSTSERDELLAIGAPAGGLRVIYNGMHPAPPHERVWEGVVLYVGELSERKDPLTAARAARAAGMRMLVAGEGPLHDALAAEGAELLGQVDDVDALMRRANIFVMPSHREGMSLAVLEAMAHGLAMVVSEAPGNVEAVGDAGLVAPIGDVAAWTDALRAATPAHGAAARERLAQRFTVERMVSGVAAAYAEVA